MEEELAKQAIETLINLLVERVRFLAGVERELELLKMELSSMHSFLKDAAMRQAHDHRARNFISNIRELAQDATDIIETFILKIDTPRSSRGLLGQLATFPSYVYHLNKTGNKIKSINVELQKAKSLDEEYRSPAATDTTSTAPSNYIELWRQFYPHHEDLNLVGLVEDVNILKGLIFGENRGRSIVSITGMAGIGKSTLARAVFKQAAADTTRFDCRAWVCVSREFDPLQVIRELLRHLQGSYPEMPQGVSWQNQFAYLREKLQLHLQSRQYFIVLDDLWESKHWKLLEIAFPKNQDKASRLLLTSRMRYIEGAQYVHSMKLLDPEKSWELFSKKAFPANEDGIPEDLKDIGRKILKRCNGLPLAITVIADVLAGVRPSKNEWDTVLRNLTNEMESDTIETILEFSYIHLSPELKSCFLCLSFFNEDAEIPAEKLIQVWIAEGLVPHGQQETAEEKARGYLRDLINHNMVQVKQMTVDGRVKKCSIEKFLLKLSIRKAIEEISLEILKGEIPPPSNKPRHSSIYGGTEKFDCTRYRNKPLRSLFFHGTGNVNGRKSTKWKKFELLRVLDLENLGVEILPDAIEEMIGLRYLGLRNNKIKKLPHWLHRLQQLEVLDIAQNLMVEFPDVIWKIKSLRHLYVSGIKCEKPLKIDMRNLQTLLYIPAAYWKAETMTSLKKLGIELDGTSDVSKLFESLARLQNLVHLKFILSYTGAIASLDRLNSLQHLTKLKLRGWLTRLPNANHFPPNLDCLSLVHTYLNEDPMPILEKVENLKYLKLHRAYRGEKMMISEDGFASLEVLSLRQLVNLNNLEVGQRALLELQRLEINSCFHLESLPEQVSTMNRLQELNMVTTRDIASKLQVNGVDYYKISNIKYVNVIGN